MTYSNSLRPLGLLVSLLGLSSFALLGAACSGNGTPGEHVDSDESALIDAQCAYFDVNGKNQICHHTGSASHPYTIIKTSAQGCINGHTGHAGDYITSTDPTSPTYDPTCNGGGCLPAGAPTDATLGCCDGLVSQNGTCVDLCAGVTCAASDQCHAAGTCNPANGTCSNPAAADGTACTDGNACSVTDACVAGTCTGSSNPCQNGGSCADGGSSFTCSCTAGWTGTTCETAACVPTTCAAQGATCGTIPDGCGGTLTCGAACGNPACPCTGNPSWDAALAGTLLADGSCDNYSFPGPCGTSAGNSWAFSVNGSSRARLIAGVEESDFGTSYFCGVQQHNSPFGCGGGDVYFLEVTATQAATCEAEVLNFAASQGGVCH